MRTTLNLDALILEELKRLQREERKPLGRLASDLLADALDRRRTGVKPRGEFQWVTKPMGARLDLEDREAVWAVLDQDRG